MLAEVRCLANVLFKILENTEQESSTVQGCKVTSLESQQGETSQASESLCDTNHSRATTRMSRGHASADLYCYSGIKSLRAGEKHLKQEKRDMCFEKLHMQKGKELPWSCRGTGDSQKPGPADKSPCFLSSKDNHPVKHRRLACSWPSVAAQPASDTR